MLSEEDLCLRGAQADFQAAGHRETRVSDLHAMCSQIEEMLQSIALGLCQLTEVLHAIKSRVDDIETWVQVQQRQQDECVEQRSPVHAAAAR